jgi:hypothetical protein
MSALQGMYALAQMLSGNAAKRESMVCLNAEKFRQADAR